VSPFWSKILLNLYPPLLINRVVIRRVSPDFKEVDVVLRKSWLNRNLNKSIFGGSIFCAADPFHALMYWKALRKKGIHCNALLKSASIRYRKPAKSSLEYKFRISEEDLQKAIIGLKADGRYQCDHYFEAFDQDGQVCAEVTTCIYLRNAPKKEDTYGSF
jgi:hypothetical protein